ncbi:FAD-dependent oxidoreductase [Parachlamydia sp. AcF125]|uniref:FAD-dependent oxidoreductase n=1 Tax=Parachlamydia sp. AcF125 TaxID=2795736 RepID=UPI001BC9D529|nr:FAD-dependent oxidoreductase [Parachlamydia sp. AcF125]MBS4168413.1 tRNA 5-methylaminomethyl-2-thiouridine biosynthesis bifunctional protein MnmC [Parachlamydia sp. AcF125]
MRIAIIGAGFSGLAAAWYFLQREHVEVTILDKRGIGGGASGIAAGLFHPYAGAHAKLNRWGKEGWEESCQLIQVAEEALGASVATRKGLLRLALTELQLSDFTLSAARYPEVQFFSEPQCQQQVPGVVAKAGIFIQTAMAVYPDRYLWGLWIACQKKGATFLQQEVKDLEELSHFDCVVLAMGSDVVQMLDLKRDPMSLVKGQLLELEWPRGLAPLPFPLSSQAYLTMSPDSKTCLVGSTFEKKFKSLEVDLEAAIQEIIPKAAAFFPPVKEMRIVKGYAGVRIASKDHLPFYKRIEANTWVLTGMGSKGLLYHALYAKQLVSSIYEEFQP